MHPSMVAHRSLSTRIVVQIDTQQLPSAGRGRRVKACSPDRRSNRSRHAVGSANIVDGPGVTPVGNKEGRQIFVDALTRFAEQNRNSRLTPIIRRIAAPVRVAVRGRDGVGRATVTAALSAAGVTVISEVDADVHAVVIAETIKPEDRAMLDSTRVPAVTILNKADLSGRGDGGPMAMADRRAAACRALTGVPTVAMVGLLATAELDDPNSSVRCGCWSTRPADLTSTDAFVQCEHPVPRELRGRLMAALDRFGIAHAVLASPRQRTPPRRRRYYGRPARSTGWSSISTRPAPLSGIAGCARRSAELTFARSAIRR